MRCSRWPGPIRRRAADNFTSRRTLAKHIALPSCPAVLRSTIKRLAQKLVGRSDVRGFARQQKLWLSKKIYRRPISIAEFRQRLIDLGVTPGQDALGAVVMERVLQCPSSPQRNDRPDARSARPRRNAGHAGVSDRCRIPTNSFSSTEHLFTPACCARSFAARPTFSEASISARRYARSVRTPIS